MNAKTVGQRIKAGREKKDLPQDALAALMDISTTNMSVMERGVKIPRLDTLVGIANALLMDEVEHATTGVTSELSSIIADLPHDEKSPGTKSDPCVNRRIMGKNSSFSPIFFKNIPYMGTGYVFILKRPKHNRKSKPYAPRARGRRTRLNHAYIVPVKSRTGSTR